MRTYHYAHDLPEGISWRHTILVRRVGSRYQIGYPRYGAPYKWGWAVPYDALVCRVCHQRVIGCMQVFKNARGGLACSLACAARLDVLLVLSGKRGAWHRLPCDFWLYGDTDPPFNFPLVEKDPP